MKCDFTPSTLWRKEESMIRKKSPTTRARRHFTPDEKATILRRHLVEKVPISTLCEESTIQPSLFYLWQKQAMDNLSTALQEARPHRAEEHLVRQARDRIAVLEASLARKDAVIADVSAMPTKAQKVSR